MSRKVLFLGDNPALNTGFGRVNAQAARAFQDAGWEVGSVSGLTSEGPEMWKGVKIYYPKENRDVLGLNIIRETVEDFKPDMLYMTADAGTATTLASASPDMAALMYVPIEGEPLGNSDWRRLIRFIPVVTCSQYGVDIIKRDVGRDVPFIYHGVDHEVFKVTGTRDHYRKMMNWQDKFVIMAVSTNVRRKQLPRLIEAVSILKHKNKLKDIVLYLHTVPFQQYWLEGHNLPEVIDYYDVSDVVVFHPNMKNRNDSIPEISKNGQPGLADLYNSADLFVNVSQVEGFGMPQAEAMACGLPTLVTKYSAGWEVVRPAGRGIPVHDWEMHKSTTRYANVDPAVVAKEILRLKNAPSERARMSAAGLERVKDFSWPYFRQEIVIHAERALDAYKERSRLKQEADSVKEKKQQEVSVPANQSGDIGEEAANYVAG